MQVTVTLNATTAQESQKLYSALAIISSALSSDLPVNLANQPTMKLPATGEMENVTKAKRGPKKSKEKIALVEDQDDEDEDEDDSDSLEKSSVDLDEDEDEVDEEEEAEAAPVRKGASAKPSKPGKTSKLTIEGDIIPAMIAYTKKHDREKAAKLLKKFGAKNVRSVPVEKYPELLAAARA